MKSRFNSLDIPKPSKEHNDKYSVDVLILYDDKCYIGYYHYASAEWRYSDSAVSEEKTFAIAEPNDLLWQKIENQ